MAKRRMFSRDITDSDVFMELPLSAQALYFHLNMNADDEGFVNAPKRIQRSIRAGDDDLKLLIAKGFVIPFDSGIIVIKHWGMHNQIRKDRCKPTIYTEEKAMIATDEGGIYKAWQPNDNQMTTKWQPNGNQMATQYSIDKYSIDKCSSRGCNLEELITEAESDKLFEMFEDADLLINEVEAEINDKLKAGKIENFYGYIIGYAKKRGWARK